jgi:hypothetical protein
MHDLPIACSWAPADLENRRRGLLPGLVARADSHEDLPDGVRWRFVSEDGLLPRIASVIDAERQCCRFLRFELVIEQDGGGVYLGVTGPPGTRDFLLSLTSSV